MVGNHCCKIKNGNLILWSYGCMNGGHPKKFVKRSLLAFGLYFTFDLICCLMRVVYGNWTKIRGVRLHELN